MTLWIKIIGTMLLVLTVLCAGFFAGWHWKGYDDLSKAKAVQDKTLTLQAKSVVTMLASNAKLVDHIDSLNTATEGMQAHTAILLEDQSHAFQAVRDQIHSLQLGACSFSAASDSVWNSTYRALFPTPAAHPAGTGQAAH
jgi:hypothetical protein